MTVRRSIVALVLAVVVGLPAGWITAMLLTPVLWRLEPILNMELAGHSGPSDWVFYVIWGVVIPLLFFAFCLVLRRPRPPRPVSSART